MLRIESKLGDVPVPVYGFLGVLYHPQHQMLYAANPEMVVWQEIEGDELGDVPLLLPVEAVQDAYRYEDEIILSLFQDMVGVGRRLYQLLSQPAETHCCFGGVNLQGVSYHDKTWDYQFGLSAKALERIRKALAPKGSGADHLGVFTSQSASSPPNTLPVHIEIAGARGGAMMFAQRGKPVVSDATMAIANELMAMGAELRVK